MQSAFTTKLISAIRFGHRHIAGITLLGVVGALAATVLFMALTSAQSAAQTKAYTGVSAVTSERDETLKGDWLGRGNQSVTTAKDSIREQDEALERLLFASFYLAPRLSSSCDGECLNLLIQQMIDLAEQVRHNY